jgi:hypothetical protein
LLVVVVLGGVGFVLWQGSSDCETSGFPTGSDAQGWEVPCKYAVNGDLYTEMTFEWASGAQVPATYYWTYDGENLTFELWGEDMRPSRKSSYGHTLVKSE